MSENEPGNFLSANVWGIHSLPGVLADRPITAFHNAAAPQLSQLSYLRSEFSPRPFPITCITYGLSQQYLLWDVYVRLMLTPMLPCDSVICISKAARQAFKSKFEQVKSSLQETGLSGPKAEIRLDVLPLGIDVELYRPRDREDTRRVLGLPQKKTLILYFGRIDHTTKGDMSPLLIAFRELLGKHGSGLILVLAGAVSDAESSSIMHTAAQLGCAQQLLIRTQPTVIEGPLYFAAADIFVSLSDTLQESFGLSPLEAMASGLPAVVSDWSGYREIVVDKVTGFHIKTYWSECDDETCAFAPLQHWRDDHMRLSQSVAADIRQLVECLDALITNRDQRASMGEAARQHVLKNYSWQRVMMQYYHLWQDLSQIAVSLPQQKLEKQSLQNPHYFRNFGHYATQTLTGQERLGITSLGRQIRRQSNIFLLHPEIRPLLNPKILKVMLKVVQMAELIKYPITVADISQRVGPRHQLTPQAMTAHIMWLLKYGLLQVMPE